MPHVYCRNFPPPVRDRENAWSRSAFGNDRWRRGSRSWSTNSKPFEVVNQDGLVGVAKPGPNVGEPGLRRASHEKLAADLGYLLELPIPPVILCADGDDFQCHNVAISLWAFPTAIEWNKVAAKLSEERRAMARAVSSAMAVFDTWTGASDRKTDHVLVNDDGDSAKLDLAYIDYAFAFSREWKQTNHPLGALRKAVPIPDLYEIHAHEMVERIGDLPESAIEAAVSRIPEAFLSESERGTVIQNLLARRGALHGLLPAA